MAQQSSVEWLFHQMIALCEDYDDGKLNYTDYINGVKEVKSQAKEMHKEDCISFAEQWEARCNEKNMDSKEQLYDEIYNK
jgi:hypothetical protein